MTHVYALGHLMGRPDCGRARRPRRRRAARPVPRPRVTAAGTPRSAPDGPVTTRQDGLRARVRGARRRQRHRGRPARRRASCSTRRSRVLVEHFWDDDARHGRRAVGRVVRRRSTATAASTPTCTPSRRCSRPPTSSTTRSLRDRAQRILTRVVHDFARGNEWRIPEHFDDALDAGARLQRRRAGAPVPSRTAPPSATGSSGPGWRCTCARASGDAAPDWLLDDAVALFDAVGPRGLGGRRRRRVRLHRRLGRPARS